MHHPAFSLASGLSAGSAAIGALTADTALLAAGLAALALLTGAALRLRRAAR